MKVLYDHLTNCTVIFLFIYHCLFTAVCGSISSVVLDQNTLLFFNLYNLLQIIKMCYYHITAYQKSIYYDSNVQYVQIFLIPCVWNISQFFVLTFLFTNFRNISYCSYHIMHYVLLDTVLFWILMVFATHIWASLAVNFLQPSAFISAIYACFTCSGNLWCCLKPCSHPLLYMKCAVLICSSMISAFP